MKDFSELYVSGKGLPEYINRLGDNLIGCELGVWTGENFAYLLQACTTTKVQYGIDPYQPYQDWNRMIDTSIIDNARHQAFTNMEESGQQSKVVFYQKTANAALSDFENSALDWIFVDGDHSYEHAIEDITNYYSKVKSKGLFAGHDYSLPGVNKAVHEYRELNNITEPLQFCDNDVWFWYKN